MAGDDGHRSDPARAQGALAYEFDRLGDTGSAPGP